MTPRRAGQLLCSQPSRRARLTFPALYKLNPQTVFFVGYAQDGSGLEDVDRVREPLVTQGRTFFVKLGYAWRP